MSQYWSAVVHGLTPYVPGEHPSCPIWSNSTPTKTLRPSPKALQAIAAETSDHLRLYPDPNGDSLKSGVAAHHGVTTQQVFVGNGSDEVLAHVFLALLKHDEPILFPDITYSFYPVYCGL